MDPHLSEYRVRAVSVSTPQGMLQIHNLRCNHEALAALAKLLAVLEKDPSPVLSLSYSTQDG